MQAMVGEAVKNYDKRPILLVDRSSSLLEEHFEDPEIEKLREIVEASILEKSEELGIQSM